MNELRNLVDGAWVEPGAPLPGLLRDANTGAELGPQAGSDAKQVEMALAAAQRVHETGVWGRLPAARRADKLEQAAAKLEGRVEAIARMDALQTGVVISLTRKIAAVCVMAFRQAAALLREPAAPPLAGPYGDLLLERLPLGVAAVISPWNAPSGIACHKLASALAAGCPAILKPSEWAPGSAQIIAEAVAEADLPQGTFQLLHGAGDIGARLAGDERVAAVSLTGGLEAGRAAARACAEGVKPAQLELGGNNPLLVLQDADLEQAAEGVTTALTTLNGQWCRALGRLLAHRAIAEPLLERVEAKLQALRIGCSMEDASQMGPLAHEAHRERVAGAVERYLALGAGLVRGGELPALGGWFFQPTIVTGLAPEHTLEEVFGPVGAAHVFADDEEAVSLANQSPYGLAAYIFGAEERSWSVARQLRAGLVKINGAGLLGLNPMAPRPAWGLSGLGDEGTRETFEFFRGSRLIGVAGK